MAISELKTLVTPPAKPSEKGRKPVWVNVQRELGCELPVDYRDFAIAYGSGTFVGAGFRLYVYNPFSDEYKSKLAEHDAVLHTDSNRGEHDVFPASPGLLAWGSDNNGNECYWLTKGLPAKWPIVLRSPEGEFEDYSGPLTSFLARVFTGDLTSNIWPAALLASPNDVRFEPSIEPPIPEYLSLHDIWRQNGNKGGFWVKSMYLGRHGLMRVLSINGQSEGRTQLIQVGPTQWRDPPVQVEIYMAGKFVETVDDLQSAHQTGFYRVDGPDKAAEGP